MAQSRRPELTSPPEIFYNEQEATKYTQNSRIIGIQHEMSERAIELLELEHSSSPQLILDIGCGSGISGETIDENGHCWIGIDISQAMLNVGKERDSTGDLILIDMGEGLPFRPGSFDGAISISALQWLCNADKRSHNPVKRLYHFFTTLYSVLNNGSRAVFQFYPSDQHQINLITSQAKRAGFRGGVLIDYPESSKAKKYYLVLMMGCTSDPTLPKPLTNIQEIPSTISMSERIPSNQKRKFKDFKKRSDPKNVKDWIISKKERRRRQGKETRADTKYTGRKRPDKF